MSLSVLSGGTWRIISVAKVELAADPHEASRDGDREDVPSPEFTAFGRGDAEVLAVSW
jgi:hypothetical protein